MNKPTCLVLGGSGFLGRETVPALSPAFEVVATSLRPRETGTLPLDLRDPRAVRDMVARIRPDAVAALAAYRDPDFCEAQPEEAFRLNTDPYRHLVHDLPTGMPLVFVSTDYVFDGDHPPYTEDSIRHPPNTYGESKKLAEDIVLSRPGSAVLRVPLLMGWTDDPRKSGFFSQLLSDLKSEAPVTLDDVLIRYPTHTRDVGQAICRLLQARDEGVYHFSTTRPLTRYAAAVEMANLLGRSSRNLQPSREVVPRAARRPMDARLETSKWLKRGYPPAHEFREVALSFIETFGIK